MCSRRPRARLKQGARGGSARRGRAGPRRAWRRSPSGLAPRAVGPRRPPRASNVVDVDVQRAPVRAGWAPQRG
eukprot:15474061-Alexandrium_andersonii.AAC.1